MNEYLAGWPYSSHSSSCSRWLLRSRQRSADRFRPLRNTISPALPKDLVRTGAANQHIRYRYRSVFSLHGAGGSSRTSSGRACRPLFFGGWSGSNGPRCRARPAGPAAKRGGVRLHRLGASVHGPVPPTGRRGRTYFRRERRPAQGTPCAPVRPRKVGRSPRNGCREVRRRVACRGARISAASFPPAAYAACLREGAASSIIASVSSICPMSLKPMVNAGTQPRPSTYLSDSNRSSRVLKRPSP